MAKYRKLSRTSSQRKALLQQLLERRKIQKKLILQQNYLTRSLLSMQIVTVVTQESLRSDSVKVTAL